MNWLKWLQLSKLRPLEVLAFVLTDWGCYFKRLTSSQRRFLGGRTCTSNNKMLFVTGNTSVAKGKSLALKPRERWDVAGRRQWKREKPPARIYLRSHGWKLADFETWDEATAVTSHLVFVFLVTKGLLMNESFPWCSSLRITTSAQKQTLPVTPSLLRTTLQPRRDFQLKLSTGPIPKLLASVTHLLSETCKYRISSWTDLHRNS